MAVLILGLVLFLGPHSLKMAVPQGRRALIVIKVPEASSFPNQEFQPK